MRADSDRVRPTLNLRRTYLQNRQSYGKWPVRTATWADTKTPRQEAGSQASPAVPHWRPAAAAQRPASTWQRRTTGYADIGVAHDRRRRRRRCRFLTRMPGRAPPRAALMHNGYWAAGSGGGGGGGVDGGCDGGGLVNPQVAFRVPAVLRAGWWRRYHFGRRHRSRCRCRRMHDRLFCNGDAQVEMFGGLPVLSHC